MSVLGPVPVLLDLYDYVCICYISDQIWVLVMYILFWIWSLFVCILYATLVIGFGYESCMLFWIWIYLYVCNMPH